MTETLWLKASEWADKARSLHEDGWLLLAYCGVDGLHLGYESRFEAVAQLLDSDSKERQTVHVAAEGDPPTIPSVVDVWGTANFMEREAYDMFGIHFDGHPNLKRLLMPEEWEGHPLRKDYGVGKVTIEFLPQPFLQIQAPGQAPDAAEAGVGTDRLGQAAPARGRESKDDR